MLEARVVFVDRINRELIGPGSDIYAASPDFSDEVIEGKPLNRYYSGILFPPKDETLEEDKSQDDDDDEINETPVEEEKEPITDLKESREEANEEEDTIRLTANLYFPTNLGLTFCIEDDINEIILEINFGTYKKASYKDIKIKYDGEGIELLNQYGFDNFIEYDYEKKILSLKHDLKGNRRKGKKSEDYLIIDELVKTFNSNVSRDHILIKHITKLLYGKDKWKRTNHGYKFSYSFLSKSKLKDLVELNGLPTNVIDALFLYSKVYIDNSSHKKYVKILFENRSSGIKEKKYNPSNEKLNLSSLFQVEIIALTEKLLSYNRINENEFLTKEEKTLNFLYEDVKSYGVGHGVACEWELKERPSWIRTSFFPQYDFNSQSTRLLQEDHAAENILEIKNLSTFSKLNKSAIVKSLKKFALAYSEWIAQKKVENNERNNKEIGNENLQNCSEIKMRIEEGIRIIEKNDNAYKAFQFANSAIYMQMFHTNKYFGKDNNKGLELFEWNFDELPKYGDYSNVVFTDGESPHWRPFQLGFILLSLKSIVEPTSDERKLVDLIWFPTGGGKTEAYLTVAAFLIFYRRLTNLSLGGGVNVIIRYTLRLLTAQQFERATKIILACEKIRRAHNRELGNEKISIGFWVGQSTIPNSCEDAKDRYDKILERLNRDEKARNIFQVNKCQWCNTKIITKINADDQQYIFGVRHSCSGHSTRNEQPCLTVNCNNPKCDFHRSKGGFPIVLIDDDIYKSPPTVLFGTVDKFAMLAWVEEGRKLFNYHNNNFPPELIIQDELHLISGPLGSLMGLYENAIQSLCTKDNITPKIITSTATSKNVEEQVKRLYGRTVSIFPPFALDTKDNFFSKQENTSTRRYIGILPTGKNYTMTQLKVLAALLFARLDIWKHPDDNIKKFADHFWTIVSYYNSLKDVGKMANKIGPELSENTLKQLHNRLLDFNEINHKRLKSHYNFKELTSREPSEKIKETLDKLQFLFDGNLTYYNKVIDLVLATNMISVGLDVQRLGVMLVNGMPRNIAEYIQCTSRVARKEKGVVVTLLNPDNSRDLSYFEHFISFHQKFYKEIEPISLTPFTKSTFEKMLLTTMVTFFRHKLGNYSNQDVSKIEKDKFLSEFQLFIQNHKGISSDEIIELKKSLSDILERWKARVNVTADLKFKTNKLEKTFLRTCENRINNDDLITMQSVRNVEPATKIKIQQY